jgi:hypothetical protein
MLLPERSINPNTERRRQRNPYEAPDGRLPYFHGMRVPVKDTKIERQQKKTDSNECSPEYGCSYGIRHCCFGDLK